LGPGLPVAPAKAAVMSPKSAAVLKQMDDFSKAAKSAIKSQEEMKKQAGNTAFAFASLTAKLGGAGGALRGFTNVLLGMQQGTLINRLSGRGDFARAARRRLDSSGWKEDYASAFPIFGSSVKRYAQGVREAAGLNDSADASDRMAKGFDAMRGFVDSARQSRRSLELSNKFAFNPEANAFQQGRLALRAGLGAQITGIEELQNETSDRFQARLAERTALKAKRDKIAEPKQYGEALSRQTKKLRALDEQIKTKTLEADEALKLRRAAHSPSVSRDLDNMRRERHETKKAQDRKFIIDQQRGTTVTSGKLGQFGVAGALDKAPKEDAISLGFKSTNTILSDIKIILDGRLPKETGKGQ